MAKLRNQPGRKATYNYEALTAKFFWYKKMFAVVGKYMGSCSQCQICKVPHQVTIAKMR
jgi:hypothetical protein